MSKSCVSPAWMSRAELQRALNQPRTAVDRLLAAGLPHETVGSGHGAVIRIPRTAALAWLADRVLAGLERGTDAAEQLNAEREKAGLLREQRLKTAFENGILTREYVKASEVEAADAVIFTALRDRVRGVVACVPLLREAALGEGETGIKRILVEALDEALTDVATAGLKPADVR